MHRDGTPDEFDRDREDWEDAQQLARQALNLHAIEARHRETMNGFSSNPGDYVNSAADVPKLLAHIRALRIVLQGIAGDERHSCLLCGLLGEHRAQCEVAIALAQATDESDPFETA